MSGLKAPALSLVFSLTLFIAGTILTMNSSSTKKTTAPYGTWPSPVTPELVAKGSTAILNMLVDGEDTYWCELRPLNKGRYTIVRRDKQGDKTDITSPDFNVRTLVHEYGGGAFTVFNGTLFASNAADSAIYKITPGIPPVKLTEGTTKVKIGEKEVVSGTRFADMHVTPKGIIAVGEEHIPGKPVENFLALIDTGTGRYKKIAVGHDFYASPAINREGTKAAWITWNFPEMPWTNTQLWTGEISNDGTLVNIMQVAGEVPEAIFQPQWAPDGTLYFVTDRDKGWWNLHRYVDGTIDNVCPMAAEAAEPLWVFERSTYAFIGKDILFTFNKDGHWHLARLNPKSKEWREIARPAVAMKQLRSGRDSVRYIEGYGDKDDAIVEVADDGRNTVRVLNEETPLLKKDGISFPQHIAFLSGKRTAYAYYYPPVNSEYEGPADKAPPLVVMIHGGPTAQARNTFQTKMQFWTSRGFAVLDVNYGGSTGYGREYRFLLDNNWGNVDVEDCINGARFLAEQGKADPSNLAIRGGSAGGFTTLAALSSSDVFKAGASYYGVADINALAHDTHKFEAKYMDLLVGPYPAKKHLWDERSPINHVDKMVSPLIIFQGEDDTVVPMNQSVMIYEALKKRGIPVEIHIYPGEEHGFRQSQNVIDSLVREWQFYLKVFGLK